MQRGIIFFIVTISAFFSSLTFGQNKNSIIKIDSGFANVNGTKLFYEIAGSGDPIVLIHGSFGDHRFWAPQFLVFSKKFRVICYDIRGFGKSAMPDSNEVYSDAGDLDALLDFLKISKAHICGLSLGSFIAIDFALTHPQKCISLIPVGPRVAGEGTDEFKSPNADSMRLILAKATQLARQQGAKAATDYLWTGDHAMGRTIIVKSTREKLLQMGYEYSWWRYLHADKRKFEFPMGIKKLNEITIPTLIVTAEYDLALCKEDAAIMAKQMKYAILISIKNAGHIMNMDNPGEFNRTVENFISSLK